MSTYSQPLLSIVQTPSHFSPVYSPNWFTFTCSTTASTATDIHLVAQVNILDQTVSSDTIIESCPRFKIPMREKNTFVFNPEQVLKSYVTYPYNDGTPIYYANWGTSSTTSSTGSTHYVNECVGFGTPSNSYPTIAPEMDGIVKYNLSYGLQWDPGITMSRLTSAVDISGITYSAYYAYGQTNLFAQEGDIVEISMDSGLFSYYNGTASILYITISYGNTYFITNQLFSEALFNITEFPTGKVSNITHIYGTSSTFYGFNGTRQFNEKDVNFDNIFYLRQSATSSVGFPNKSYPAQPLNQFLNDWGKTYQEAIPIRPGQCERARFLADMYDFISEPQYATNRLAKLTIETFNQNLTLLGTQSISLHDGEMESTPFPQKCFTIQLFDKNSIIIDGYYYKFSLWGYSSPSGIPFVYTSIWYKGSNPCSRYTNVRIKFLNRWGTWSYWNFNKDNKQTTKITREYYNSPIQYNQSLISSTTDFKLSNLRGQNVLNIAANDEFLINSDWITEAESIFLQQLITTTQAYIFYDTYTLLDGTKLEAVNIPIIITDSQYEYKTINRNQIFNLQLTYKMSNDQSIQNP